MKTHNQICTLTQAAMFLALSYVLPFLTGNMPMLGERFCLLHIPVILCGYVCGAPWGFAVGFIAPLLRSLTLGVPVLFPRAVSMAFELAAYGFFSGYLYRVFPKKKGYIYISLIISMVVGRLVRFAVQFAVMGFDSAEYGFSAFWTGSVVTAIPGIVMQILIIPVLVVALEKVRGISDSV